MVVSNASIKIYEIYLNPEVLCIFTFKSTTEILFNEQMHRYYLHIVKDIKMT
jgi:predicted metal-dependent peptidase